MFDAPAFLGDLDRFFAATDSGEVLLSLASLTVSDRAQVRVLVGHGDTHTELLYLKTEPAAWSALLSRSTRR